MCTQITLKPDMENQALWCYWTTLRNLRRKFLDFEGVSYQVELSPEVLKIVKDRRKNKNRESFNRYLSTHREAYNKIYRERYHILKEKRKLESKEHDSEELVIELELPQNMV